MTYLGLGLILFLLGCFHMLDGTARFDLDIVLFAQQLSNRKPLLALFREIWFFGRTSFALVALVFLICINWKLGLTAAAVFSTMIGIEYLLKTLYFRKRPHAAHQAVSMLQPLEPRDSSFPSGDALRVWFLALIITTAAGSSPSFLAAAVSLAILVTLGRIVMGVHYLTDTLAGAGLGCIGAGLTIWLWNVLGIL